MLRVCGSNDVTGGALNGHVETNVCNSFQGIGYVNWIVFCLSCIRCVSAMGRSKGGGRKGRGKKEEEEMEGEAGRGGGGGGREWEKIKPLINPVTLINNISSAH